MIMIKHNNIPLAPGKTPRNRNKTIKDSVLATITFLNKLRVAMMRCFYFLCS